MATEEFTGEEWRPIAGLPYHVSSFGRVMRTSRGGEGIGRRREFLRLLAGRRHPLGYRSVHIGLSGAFKWTPVHRLVMEAFVGPCPAGHQVNHIDADPTNNRLDNLEYVTPAGNIHHAMSLGRHPHGETHGRAVLSEADVAAIRTAAAGGEPVRAIARRTGRGRNTIRQIVFGTTWRHLLHG